MRSLVSVQTVKTVSPIQDADRIELAHVLGWQCVVKKGQFQPGEKCVYFEIDSFLPIRPEFEFLRGRCYRKNELVGAGFRIRTQKFRGEISQGLIIGMSEAAAMIGLDTDAEKMEVGTDLTALLGVQHWEEPETVSDAGTFIGSLPDGVIASDETRVQACPELIRAFHGLEYYISTKMDGTSCTASIDSNGVFHVCSHHNEYKDDGRSAFCELVKSHDTEKKLRDYMGQRGLSSIMAAGEYCGPGIQSNRIHLKTRDWYLFDVRENGKRCNLAELQRVAEIVGFKTVPVEEIGTGFDEKYPTVEAVLEWANGSYETGTAKEGIVIRPTDPVYSNEIETYLSMKAVSNRYLLKNE